MNLANTLNHPLRLTLASEIHSRPFMVIDAPARISHLAVHWDGQSERHDALLESLCNRFGIAPPKSGAQHFFHDVGHFRIKWERHSEFSTFTFVEPDPLGDADFGQPAIRHVPADWLESLDGAVIVASHIHTERGEPLDIADERLQALLPKSPRVGSRVLSGGEIWTDFQVGPDGFSRFLIRDTGLREAQMGRLVQRICEIETYLMMALLALPLARQCNERLDRIEEDLAGFGAQMRALDIDADAEELLREISNLDGQTRAMSLSTGYRFSASQAYYHIVQARIGELRERRIEGVPTIGEFMERRLAPAMDTCVSVAERQEALASNVSRANDMLRTRVSLAQERQNQNVLESLSRNARLQLKLQQAVEGLSVVALSYYGIGLASYALKALNGWGIDIPVDRAVGLALPLVAGVAWFGLRRMHERLHQGGKRPVPVPSPLGRLALIERR
ncbi:DUF3422 family protein [Aromatoleum toluvorans]|uniref:DUF3422 family protein n=1 Tax=Aromatoleum toluvorans TaxID=92002 RepID=A0ABX1PZ20_9RHOO|nr:DUF3422 domain-containing protein [Aromatoleum toluvorans]NMG43736.1 DUF3422 family protein [Aromatoleum toluvorans]